MKRNTLDEHSLFGGDSSNDHRSSSPYGDSNNNRSGGGGGGGVGGSRMRTPDSERSYGSQTSNTVYKSSRPASRQSDSAQRNDDFDNDNMSGGRSATPSSWLDRGNSLDEAVYVNEEIRPGVVLEGYAIEI